jgi:hypothetical protein
MKILKFLKRRKGWINILKERKERKGRMIILELKNISGTEKEKRVD